MKQRPHSKRSSLPAANVGAAPDIWGPTAETVTLVGFEPTQLALVELESTPLDHPGKVSPDRWSANTHRETGCNMARAVPDIAAHSWGRGGQVRPRARWIRIAAAGIRHSRQTLMTVGPCKHGAILLFCRTRAL